MKANNLFAVSVLLEKTDDNKTTTHKMRIGLWMDKSQEGAITQATVNASVSFPGFTAVKVACVEIPPALLKEVK